MAKPKRQFFVLAAAKEVVASPRGPSRGPNLSYLPEMHPAFRAICHKHYIAGRRAGLMESKARFRDLTLARFENSVSSAVFDIWDSAE